MNNTTTETNNNGIFQGEYGKVEEHLESYQFPVEEVSLKTASGLVVPGRRAIVRTDTNDVLGTVGSNYKLLSHADALDPLLNELERRKEKMFKRIALTQNGARMYANIYFPDQETRIRNNGDTFYPGITVINSLDGTLKYHLEASIFRLICTNGMRVPERIAGGAAVHSKNKDYTEMVENILGFVGNKDKFGIFQAWANEVVKTEAVEALIDKLLKDKGCNFPVRYRDLVVAEAEREAKYGVLSIWNIYNAFNSVLEHHLIREKGRFDRARLLDENMFKLFMKKFPQKKVAA